MKAKKIFESLNDILKPKTIEEIEIDPNIKELINDCYELISKFPNRFIITRDINVYKENLGRIYYGFDFEEYKNYSNKEMNKDYINKLTRYRLEFDHSDNKQVLLSIIHNKNIDETFYTKDIKDIGDFIFYFNLYKPITESIDNILKPKNYDDIFKSIPIKIINLMKNFYNLIKNSKNYDIIISLNINKFDDYNPGFFAYGFSFNTKEPFINNHYHSKEIGEYKLLYDSIDNKIILIFENNGAVFEIENEKVLKLYLDLKINESLDNLLSPKSEKEVKDIFKENYPIFYKIYKELFSTSDFEINLDNVPAANVYFTVNNIKFLLSQSIYASMPRISYYLNKDNFIGVFKDSKSVANIDEVKNYINSKIK